MGYATCSWILFVSGFLMLAFPKEMVESRKKRLEAIKKGELPTTDDKIDRNLKGMFKATMQLLSNKTFVFAVFGITSATILGASLGAFFPKFVTLKFGATTSVSGVASGVVLFPAMTGNN